MRLPKTLQPHTIIIKEYKGSSAYEDLYDEPYEIDGYMEESRTFVRNDEGDQVISNSQFFTSEDVYIPPKSIIKYNNREYIVITTQRHTNALTGKLAHVEVVLE